MRPTERLDARPRMVIGARAQGDARVCAPRLRFAGATHVDSPAIDADQATLAGRGFRHARRAEHGLSGPRSAAASCGAGDAKGRITGHSCRRRLLLRCGAGARRTAPRGGSRSAAGADETTHAGGSTRPAGSGVNPSILHVNLGSLSVPLVT